MRVSQRNGADYIRIPRRIKTILRWSWLRPRTARQSRDLARWKRKLTTCDLFIAG